MAPFSTSLPTSAEECKKFKISPPHFEIENVNLMKKIYCFFIRETKNTILFFLWNALKNRTCSSDRILPPIYILITLLFPYLLVDKLAEECLQLTPAFDIKLFENERDEDFAVFEDPDEAPNPFIGGNNFQTLVRSQFDQRGSYTKLLRRS